MTVGGWKFKKKLQQLSKLLSVSQLMVYLFWFGFAAAGESISAVQWHDALMTVAVLVLVQFIATQSAVPSTKSSQ